MNTHLAMKSARLLACILAAACCPPVTESKSDDADNAAPPAANSMRGKEVGQVRDDNCLKMKLVWCPPGFVTMEQLERIKEPVPNDDATDEDDPTDKADPEEFRFVQKITPVKVLLTRGYWLGKYEVTQSEWKQLMKSEWRNPGLMKEGADIPAAPVRWDDAMRFCRNLTDQERQSGRLPEGWEYTLPTEAQWERACRARTETAFSFGDDEQKLEEYAWFEDNALNGGERFAHRVGQKRANPWGLYDMHGNVWEWCRDAYAQKLPGGRDPEVQPGENANASRVFRGGSWNGAATGCRSGFRCRPSGENRDVSFGFRVALSVK